MLYRSELDTPSNEVKILITRADYGDNEEFITIAGGECVEIPMALHEKKLFRELSSLNACPQAPKAFSERISMEKGHLRVSQSCRWIDTSG